MKKAILRIPLGILLTLCMMAGIFITAMPEAGAQDDEFYASLDPEQKRMLSALESALREVDYQTAYSIQRTGEFHALCDSIPEKDGGKYFIYYPDGETVAVVSRMQSGGLLSYHMDLFMGQNGYGRYSSGRYGGEFRNFVLHETNYTGGKANGPFTYHVLNFHLGETGFFTMQGNLRDGQDYGPITYTRNGVVMQTSEEAGLHSWWSDWPDMPQPTQTPPASTDPPPSEIPAPAPQTVNPTASTVFINGTATEFEAYLIDGNNFFKLRDLAYVLNGTNKQFAVGYDNATRAITLTSGNAYEPDGGEMILGDGTPKSATLNTSINISIDGSPVEITAYLISGNNFMRLRDLMRLLDIGVGYDNTTRNITIDTSLPYTEE